MKRAAVYLSKHAMITIVLFIFLMTPGGASGVRQADKMADGVGKPQQDTKTISEVNAGTTTRVSVASDGTLGNGGSEWPAISTDGRYVAFTS